MKGYNNLYVLYSTFICWSVWLSHKGLSTLGLLYNAQFLAKVLDRFIQKHYLLEYNKKVSVQKSSTITSAFIGRCADKLFEVDLDVPVWRSPNLWTFCEECTIRWRTKYYIWNIIGIIKHFHFWSNDDSTSAIIETCTGAKNWKNNNKDRLYNIVIDFLEEYGILWGTFGREIVWKNSPTIPSKKFSPQENCLFMVSYNMLTLSFKFVISEYSL